LHAIAGGLQGVPGSPYAARRLGERPPCGALSLPFEPVARTADSQPRERRICARRFCAEPLQLSLAARAHSLNENIIPCGPEFGLDQPGAKQAVDPLVTQRLLEG